MKYANEMAGVTEARKQGEIEGRINALSAALSTAEDALGDLEQRLAPITRQELGKGNDSPEPVYQTALARDINNLVNRTIELSQRIRGQYDRTEL
jgi:hypothetical protein